MSKSSSGNGKFIVGAIIAIIIGGAAIVAISSSGSESNTSSSNISEFSDITVTGDALPGFDSASTDASIGMTAPIVSGKGFTGTEITTDGAGTPTLLVFLAHWCQFCQREVPLLVEWEKDGKTPTGVDVIAVATGTDPANPNFPPSEWLAREEFPALWPVIADSADKKAANAFGLSGYPFFVLVDAQGKVFTRLSGEIPMDELTAIINQMIGV
ncbi:MAG: TlpA family protein disulfide reductase [Ilumatobacteraceae bacterium]|jgi:thiol-disulfide isomerase/thioredoxin